jgi:hypothetical protein
MPYGGNEPNIQPIQTNIFLTGSNPELSEKLSFPYDKYNSKNSIIDILRIYKDSPNTNKFTNYLISILYHLINFNYSSMNFYLNFINNMPETLIILFAPIITIFYITFIFILDHIYLIYLWFSQMYWFFKKNVSNTSDTKVKWSDITFLQPGEYSTSILLVILFLFLFWIYFLGIPFISFILLCWCVFSILGYKGILNSKETNIFGVIKEMFKHFKVTIMTIISIFVIISSFSNLGTIPGIFCLFVVSLIYYGTLSINLFKSINDEKFTKLVSYEQAKKTCKINNGIFSDMLKKLNVPFFSGGAHNKLIQEINKISKKMNN